MAAQEEILKDAGAKVYQSSDQAVHFAGKLIQALIGQEDPSDEMEFKPVELGSLIGDFAGINLGLESFTESLRAQDADAVQVDWKPAAGGDTDLMALLEKMKG